MNTKGFTLIELAIALVIFTILIGGLAVPLSAQIQARRIAETNRTLAEAREALIGYTMSHSCSCEYNGVGAAGTAVLSQTCSSCPLPNPNLSSTTLQRHYLPCPDMRKDDPEPGDNDNDGSQADFNNGREDRYMTGGACAAGSGNATSSGNLPWVTLGTAAQDAWGNRLTYSLTAVYGNKSSGFSIASEGINQVCDTTSGGCVSGNVAAKVPVVILSYGPNGWGARNVNGNPLADPTSAHELENTDTNGRYVTHAPTAAPQEFDDLVVWISDGLLRSRVCPAGGCP
jgi:prepilin-type N-terminal cleavage/methylation domain-containing protein